MPDTPFDAFLFDMDGTLINSIPATERVWGAWARAHGLDVAAFLPTMHGKRAVETVRALALPGVDPEEEARRITAAEIGDCEGILPLPGAVAFVSALPPDRWAIVTSAPLELALRRLAAAGMPLPEVLVTADDVTRGKPAPDGYLLAARRLGREARACLVFEDAPAGIAAAEAAGAAVMVVDATHRHPVATDHPTLSRYDQFRPVSGDGGLRLVRTEVRAVAR